jgi:hypothetical protein
MLYPSSIRSYEDKVVSATGTYSRLSVSIPPQS